MRCSPLRSLKFSFLEAAKAIVNRRRRTVDGTAILPAAARLENMNDPADDVPVVGSARSRLVLREKRFDRCPLRLAQPKFLAIIQAPIPIRLKSQLCNSLNALIECRA